MKTFLFLLLCLSLLVARRDPDTAPASPALLVDTLAGALVLVKGGTFDMGSNVGESTEKPVHRVMLSDYYLGQYEVTVAQFKTFVDDIGYPIVAEPDNKSNVWNGESWEKKTGVDWRCDTEGNPRPSSDYNHPVIHVTWNDAQAYCSWLSRKTGKTYRLPTEAEWEYAARGGGQSKGYLYAGSNNLDDVAWYGANSGNKTHPVGEKQANELGLHDMSGNVFECCSDRFGDYASGYVTNPTGPSSGAFRVLRGGSWFSRPELCCVSDRNVTAPYDRTPIVGFRVARAASF